MMVIPHKTKKISATIIIDNETLVKHMTAERLGGTNVNLNTRGEYYDFIVQRVCKILDDANADSTKFQIIPAYDIRYTTRYEFNSYAVVISAIPNPEKYATPHRVDEFVDKCKDIMLTIADAFNQSSIDIEINDVLVHTYRHK